MRVQGPHGHVADIDGRVLAAVQAAVLPKGMALQLIEALQGRKIETKREDPGLVLSKQQGGPLGP